MNYIKYSQIKFPYIRKGCRGYIFDCYKQNSAILSFLEPSVFHDLSFPCTTPPNALHHIFLNLLLLCFPSDHEGQTFFTGIGLFILWLDDSINSTVVFQQTPVTIIFADVSFLHLVIFFCCQFSAQVSQPYSNIGLLIGILFCRNQHVLKPRKTLLSFSVNT